MAPQETTITLVDLAGAEKFGVDATSDKETQMEGKDIQHGLLALGKVLEALKGGSAHVPYRDSTMTLMLRDALNGECTTMVLACVNPGLNVYPETRNVLEFVLRASNVHGSDASEEEEAGWFAKSAYDPMEFDSFDTDESLNRRTELVETVNFGAVHCRCVGDPMDPLILYLHGRAGPGSGESPEERGVEEAKRTKLVKRGTVEQGMGNAMPNAAPKGTPRHAMDRAKSSKMVDRGADKPPLTPTSTGLSLTRERAAQNKAARDAQEALRKAQEAAAKEAKFHEGRVPRLPNSKSFNALIVNVAKALNEVHTRGLRTPSVSCILRSRFCCSRHWAPHPR